MEYKEALVAFSKEMQEKLELRAERKREKSITLLSPDKVFSWDEIWGAFVSEVNELTSAPHDTTEAVDVANMAFIIWWFRQELRQKPHGWIVEDDDGETN